MMSAFLSDYLVRRADTARDLRDWRKAARRYALALRLSPQLAPIWVQKGHAAKESGDLDGAGHAYAQALALAPEDADTHLQIGHLAAVRGQQLEALEAYRLSLRLDPERPDARRCLADLLPAHIQTLIRAGKRDPASDAAGELVQLTPLEPGAWLLRLRTAALANQGPIAVEAACRAVALAGREMPAPPGWPPFLAAEHLLVDHLGTIKGDEHWFAALRAVRDRLRPRILMGLRNRHGPRADRMPRRFRSVVIGTTGLCNASCIHCPTGKDATGLSPRHPMPMALFETVIRQLAQLRMNIQFNINLGLFGDSLVDPFILERVRLARSILPDATLVLVTNGAAYNRTRHKPLAEVASAVALHVESLVPETYNRLMQPLRAERVFPKFDQLAEDFAGKFHVSVPVSRANEAELPAIRAHFLARGALSVIQVALSSRCARDDTAFRALAINPVRHRCEPRVADDLIIDCDGRVLMCCNDFERLESIGELSRETLFDVMTNDARHEMRQTFAAGGHDRWDICRRCHFGGRELAG